MKQLILIGHRRSNNSFSSYGNSNVDNRIQRLERKVQDDINELNAIRVSSGRMNHER